MILLRRFRWRDAAPRFQVPNVLVIDTETTGLTPSEDRIVEIAAVMMSGERFSSLVSPIGRPIPPTASAVHHLRDADVAKAPLLSDIESGDQWEHLMDAQVALAAHNAAFDRGFLVGSGQSGSPEYYRDARWICTWRCAMHLWPEAPSHSNQVLRYFLDLTDGELGLPRGLAPHRALYDALVTAGILRRMLRRHALDQLLDMTTRPALLLRVRGGRYDGRLWSEMDDGYLRWTLDPRRNFSEDVLHTARHHLEQRR